MERSTTTPDEFIESVADGAPRYAWSSEDRDYWTLSRESLGVQVLRRLTRPGHVR